MTFQRPRLLVAGAHSGVGKTSISLGIAAALKRRGMEVRTFKVGPDFLDPTYLSIASGKACYNLDTWMTSDEYVVELFTGASLGSDFSVIEGVMGLFDGSDPATSQGSSAQIARLLKAPILLIVDARGMARSLAALVKGYVEFEPGLLFAGIIANNCGSERHGKWLADSFDSCALPPLLGAVPRGELPELPSRHLGLVTADEGKVNPELLERMANAVEKYISMDRVIEAGRNSDPIFGTTEKGDPLFPKKNLRLGLARDEAFHFYYRDNLEKLEGMGMDLVEFSPLRDAGLPDRLDGIYLGGGYPELYAGPLAENRPMIDDIRRFAKSGGAIYAECGGLMYLAQGLETVGGESYEMAGILPVRTRMLARRKALGYVEATIRADTFLGRKGEKIRGHEFHYSELASSPEPAPGWSRAYSIRRTRSNRTESEGFVGERIMASYVHCHFASRPKAVQSFVSYCGGSHEQE